MVAKNKGHIVNIGSIAGNYPYKGGNVYAASKAFVQQLTLNIKADLLGTAVRVSNIEPGMVADSEFSLVRFKGDIDKACAVYEGIEALSSIDVANTVLWVLAQPAHVNINKIELMSINQAPQRTAYHKGTS
jgi:3-hydroxy acid dehydrogenase/malonic semialdehyde reductase